VYFYSSLARFLLVASLFLFLYAIQVTSSFVLFHAGVRHGPDQILVFGSGSGFRLDPDRLDPDSVVFGFGTGIQEDQEEKKRRNFKFQRTVSKLLVQRVKNVK
jgi:hypothetical protein